MKIEYKKYLPYLPVVILIIGMSIIIYLMVNGNPHPDESPVLKQLQDQQKDLKKLQEEKAEETRRNMERDSLLLVQIQENNKARERQLNNIIRNTHEKIDRINSPDFTADSIRKLFSED